MNTSPRISEGRVLMISSTSANWNSDWESWESYPELYRAVQLPTAVSFYWCRAEGQWRDQRDWGDRGVRRKYSMWYSNWGVAPSACRGYILWQRVHRIIWNEQEDDRGNYRGQGEWQRIVEQNRIKLLMTDQWCHHKRLTIIRTKARGNITGRKEIVAGDKRGT